MSGKMAAFVMAWTFFVTGCAAVPNKVERYDGGPLDMGDYERVAVICRGRLTESMAHTPYKPVSNDVASIAAAMAHAHNSDIAMMRGCMAQHGYRIYHDPNS